MSTRAVRAQRSEQLIHPDCIIITLFTLSFVKPHKEVCAVTILLVYSNTVQQYSSNIILYVSLEKISYT